MPSRWNVVRMCGMQKRRLSLAFQAYEPKNHGTHDVPIVILHGLYGSKQNSRSISKMLAQELSTKAFALDLRNHGDSPHHEVHTYRGMAADVQQFIECHLNQPAILIGHSMGAKVAMTLALQSPSSVHALIPVDNAPVEAELNSNFSKYLLGMKYVEEQSVKTQREADAILQSFEDNLTIRQFLLTNLKAESKGGSLRLRLPHQILASSLPAMGGFPYGLHNEVSYKGPTLIIRGSKSCYVPDTSIPAIRKFFPNFELCNIDSGHWVISERPIAVRDAVINFIRNIALTA